MKVKNEANKEQIIKKFGIEYYNALENAGKEINKVIRKHQLENSSTFMKRMYEKRDKLREQEEKKKKIE
jgi:hypothetical protein